MKRCERDSMGGRMRPTTDSRMYCGGLAICALAVFVMAVGLAPGAAQAQFPEYSRIGLSLAPDHYERYLEIGMDETFEVYVVALGHNDEDPLPFDVAALRWAIYQACCGSDLEILSTTYSDQLEHSGDPLGGVVSSSELCVTDDFLYLASVTIILRAQSAGTYFVAAGPTDWATDCNNENVTMTDLPVEITLTEVTPNSNQSSWSTVKSIYR